MFLVDPSFLMVSFSSSLRWASSPPRVTMINSEAIPVTYPLQYFFKKHHLLFTCSRTSCNVLRVADGKKNNVAPPYIYSQKLLPKPHCRFSYTLGCLSLSEYKYTWLQTPYHLLLCLPHKTLSTPLLQAMCLSAYDFWASFMCDFFSLLSTEGQVLSKKAT